MPIRLARFWMTPPAASKSSFAFRVDACVHGMVRRNPGDPSTARRCPLRDSIANAIVGADNRRARIPEYGFLHGGVVFEGSVPVEVVGRDVEKDGNVRIEAWRQIELEA